ncbi:curli assembly protein CsgF [Halanaerobacter jeridensis]|uniref:Curli production assembly/transport component CsgF n=1 Tax=Halanaerobacter jeridensis TaxID=706427 RepID=A0A939BT08_9FIRM|nr:curli assembly protein CsgF [Halanaerobacter jeridensis]MBM7557721.1 hypothetical protein [Halanaerobacter jeridensis]
MKKKMVLLLTLIMFLSGGNVNASNHTMSWDFQMFSNYNYRQVAMNVAQIQKELVKEEEDAIEEFKDDLERRLFSSAQRKIVDMILNEDEIPYGKFEAGDLKITVAEDPLTGEVLIDIVDVVSGDSTTINYSSDDWATGYDW